MSSVPQTLELPQDYWDALTAMARRADMSPDKMLLALIREAQAQRSPPPRVAPMRIPTVNGPKQMLVLRKDLGMRKGKMVAQGAHASLAVLLEGAVYDAEARTVTLQLDAAGWTWLVEDRFKKICVGVNSEDELLELWQQAKSQGIPCALILDAGLTEFKQPTRTALALGPAAPEQLDVLTGHLGLL